MIVKSLLCLILFVLLSMLPEMERYVTVVLNKINVCKYKCNINVITLSYCFFSV